MSIEFTDDDEGKPVVDPDGDQIGIVSSVDDDGAFVDPDPGVSDTVMSKLGWGEADQEDFPLDESSIDKVTDREVRLKL